MCPQAHLDPRGPRDLLRRSIKWRTSAIAGLAAVILTAACSANDQSIDQAVEGGADTAVVGSEEVPGVEVFVAPGSVASGVVLEAGIGDTGPGISGTEDLGLSFSISAQGEQPTVPVEVRVDADLINPGDPDLVFLARWDEVEGVWVPLVTSFDSGTNEYVVLIDHFSPLKFWEWGVWEDIGNGISWTAEQISGAFEWVTAKLGESLDLVGEFLAAGAGVVVDWLGLAGVEAPTCSGDQPADVELVLSDTGANGVIKACFEAGDDGHVVIRAANNRPYGLVLDRPAGVTVSLEEWPDLGLSGEAAVYSFYEALSFLEQTYIPPSATVRIDVDMADRDNVVLEATSTPALVGVDMAAEWLYLFYGRIDDVDLAVESADCLLGGGRSLADVSENGLSANPVQFLEGVKDCLIRFGYDFGEGVLGDLYGVAKATLRAAPALVSNLFDTDYSEFQVSETISLVSSITPCMSDRVENHDLRAAALCWQDFGLFGWEAHSTHGLGIGYFILQEGVEIETVIDDRRVVEVLLQAGVPIDIAVRLCKGVTDERMGFPHVVAWHCSPESNSIGSATPEVSGQTFSHVAGKYPGLTPGVPWGSGCSPGTPEFLPDGVWFGAVTEWNDNVIGFDLACLVPSGFAELGECYSGPLGDRCDLPLVSNQSDHIRYLPLWSEVGAYRLDGTPDANLRDVWFGSEPSEDEFEEDFSLSAVIIGLDSKRLFVISINDGRVTELVHVASYEQGGVCFEFFDDEGRVLEECAYG